jgi:PadR family transcriptional regulator PadR
MYRGAAAMTKEKHAMKDDLTAAPAAPVVLTALAEGESYGYAILKRVRELSGGRVEWPDGMLYPLLHRLRRLGYVADDWRAASEGYRRRYYRLTPIGRGSGEVPSRESTSANDSSGTERMLTSRVPAHWPPRCRPALAAGNPLGGHR